MKRYTIVLFFLLAALPAAAQDLVEFSTGKEATGNVLEIVPAQWLPGNPASPLSFNFRILA
jgi:hypothetical protein